MALNPVYQFMSRIFSLLIAFLSFFSVLDSPMRAIKITSLPSRSQNPNLKETIYDECVKFGRIVSIRMDGEADKKVCFVLYKRGEHAQLAVDSLNDRLFLQQTLLKVERIDCTPLLPSATVIVGIASNPTASSFGNGSASDAAVAAAATNGADELDDLDEYCQKATRTLYIGNLDRDVKYSDLREKLDKKYGDIIEIEIKKDNKKSSSSQQQASSGTALGSGGNNNNPNSSSSNNSSNSGSSSSNSYAFIQFSDIKSVIKAMRCLSGKSIGANTIKLGFGKIKPTKILWLDGIAEQLREPQLADYFNAYCENTVEQILVDRAKCQALVYFSYIEDAKVCAEKIRAKRFYDKRIMVDFASKEFINSRFEHLLDPKHHLFGRLQSSAKSSSATSTSSSKYRQRSASPLNNNSHNGRSCSNSSMNLSRSSSVSSTTSKSRTKVKDDDFGDMPKQVCLTLFGHM